MNELCGTRGIQHHNCRLTERQVIQIYKRANKGEKQESLAAEFKVNQRTISKIKVGKSWRHLKLWEKQDV